VLQVVKIFKNIIFFLILIIVTNPAIANTADKSLPREYNVKFEKIMTCIFEISNKEKDIFQAGLTENGNFFFEEPFPLNKEFSSVSEKILFVKKKWWGKYELEIKDRKNNISKLIFDFENKTSELMNKNGKFKSKECL
jgi:hypothetical protein